jgi:ADP-ribose pyrophosphatase YjhB (NUDIX family)
MRMNILHMSTESSVRVTFVLMIPRYLYLINGIAWEIPGGHVNERETPMEAAQRECLEETGFFYDDLKPVVCFCPGLDDVANPNSIFYSESVEERWPFMLDPAEALAMACCPSRAASPWFQNAKSLTA